MAKARTAEKLLQQLRGAEAANRRHKDNRKALQKEVDDLRARVHALEAAALAPK